MNNEVIFKLIILICIFIIFLLAAFIKIYFRDNERNISLKKDKYFDYQNLSISNFKFIIMTIIVIMIFFIWHVFSIYLGINSIVRLVFSSIAIIYFTMYLLSLLYQPVKRSTIDNEYVVVLIPLYNEKQGDFIECLKSLVNQTRLPDEIHVVDDGSSFDYNEAIGYFEEICTRYHINGTWKRQSNKGKRHAQVTGFKNIRNKSAVILTIDSDGVLDPNAIENGIIPFVNKKVMSVAGIVLTRNIEQSFLVKIQELLYVSNQIIDRQFMSLFGCVLVNSGAIAFYRYEVIEKALNMGYLKEYFNGIEMSYSDDSYLTIAALSAGRCVVQSNAFVYSLMPNKLKQHKRQQLRWQRGAFIRGFWRVKYAKINTLIFFKQLYSWLISLLMIVLFVYIIIIFGTNVSKLLLYLFVPIVLYGYLSTIRVLDIKRNDLKPVQYFRMMIIWTIPCVLWNAIVIRFLKVYAILSLNNRGWNTR
jgi:hyaluronan synthase